mgnify:CR=1 FL=1
MRQLVGEVLQEKVDDHYFQVSDAKRLALKMFSDNATEFFDWVQAD